MHGDAPLLRIERLTAGFEADGRVDVAVRDLSLEVRAGETLGLVGESGSGKTVTALAVLRLLPPSGRTLGGRILFQGRDLLQMDEEDIRRVRGAGIGFVFQDAMAALNPVFRVGDQLAEALVVHGMAEWPDARRRAVELLAAVRMRDPERCARSFPHQLSGGMRQRAMIAVALACRPSLIIADEPTTALDATVQAEILDLLAELRDRFAVALLLISHDLGVIAAMAQRVAVMYAGQIVEEAPVRRLFEAPHHPYTRALLTAMTTRRAATVDAGDASTREIVPRSGCPFEPRCPERVDACRTATPAHHEVHPAHRARCHHYAVAVHAAR